VFLLFSVFLVPYLLSNIMMHASALRASMRGILLALLIVPLACAEPIGQCVQNGCVRADDADGDGSYEWANAAFVVGEQVILSANLNNSTYHVAAGVTTEELVEEADYAGVEADSEGNATSGLRSADAYVGAYQGSEETGEVQRVAYAYVRADDTDGDGVPDSVTTLP
jgi:hypothetical protein